MLLFNDAGLVNQAKRDPRVFARGVECELTTSDEIPTSITKELFWAILDQPGRA